MPRTSRRGVRTVALALLVTIGGGVALPAVAQSVATDTLSGVVQDARGLPLLGAFVAVIAVGADQPAAVVVTDARGSFSVPKLASGVYSVLVGSLGFSGTVLQGIQVPSTAPVMLQLEPETTRALSAVQAPLDLSWALRSGKRDVLRQTETLVVDAGLDEGGATAPGAAGVDGTVRGTFVVGGELRLWSFTDVGDRETVGVTSLSLGTGDIWNLQAHVGQDGSLWAASNIERDLGSGHQLHVGFGFVGGDLDMLRPVGDPDTTDSWIGRLEVRDTWSLDPFRVTYGARYEHHNYLADSSLISPSLEVEFDAARRTRLFTGVSYDARGLGLADDHGFEVLSVLNQAGLRLGDTTRIHPERALRYHLGVEQRIGDAHVQVRAYYDDVTDELLGVYMSDAQGLNNYLLFNVGDASSRGFELGVAADLLDSVSGHVTYAFRDRDTAYPTLTEGMPSVGFGFDGDEMTQTHEVHATVAAELALSRTYLQATYNWRHGLPVVQDGRLRSDFGRFDLQVRQPLPFRTLRSEWSAMFEIRNLLGPDYDGLYNISLAELVGLTRGIAGGLAVRF